MAILLHDLNFSTAKSHPNFVSCFLLTLRKHRGRSLMLFSTSSFPFSSLPLSFLYPLYAICLPLAEQNFQKIFLASQNIIAFFSNRTSKIPRSAAHILSTTRQWLRARIFRLSCTEAFIIGSLFVFEILKYLIEIQLGTQSHILLDFRANSCQFFRYSFKTKIN